MHGCLFFSVIFVMSEYGYDRVSCQICLSMSVSRIEQEKNIIALMIRLYCRKKEKNERLCPECEELLDYAYARLERCPFGEEKTSCKRCPVHCYKPAMRERMKRVMRFSGPRMLIYAPTEAMRHWLKK